MFNEIEGSLQLLFTTTRIDILFKNQQGTGTGFFFQFPLSQDQYIPIVVTNKHVVEKAEKGFFYLHTMDKNGSPNLETEPFIAEFNNFHRMWIYHPDEKIDLCIMPIASLLNYAEEKGIKIYYKAFSPDLIPDTDRLNKLTPIEEVIMIGYPIGLRDEKHNLPVIRKGSTASHPAVDYNDNPEFLIDMACFPGSSGSPVLVYNQGSYPTQKGITIGTRIYLLGILYSGLQFNTEGKIIVKNIPTKQEPVTEVSIPVNLGCVIKSQKLLDFEKSLIN